ncbi:hypothetical protein F164LOC_10670 [Pectobacterium carotovorum]|nr:hypothetical protein F164LOC_10670 [Pectobacterium carotovorum]
MISRARIITGAVLCCPPRFPPRHSARIKIYSSYFKLHVRWLRLLTRITYLSKLIVLRSLAACLKLELFRV